MNSTFVERRSGTERRSYSIGAYWRGARNPRRRDWRRTADAVYPIVDWHSPRVFALVLAILLLCATDGVMTVMLLANGAIEVNPFMARLVPHSLGWFAAVKLLLTAAGLAVLAACSRMKFFRALSGEMLLVLMLLAYAGVVGWELRLLGQIG